MDAVSPLRLILDWVSHTDGVVALTVAATFTAAQALLFATAPAPVKVRGLLKSIETVPGYLGDKATLCPTDAYTVKLADAYGWDILGNLAGRSGLLAEKVEFASRPIVDSELTLTIAGAGSGKKGRVIVEFDSIGTVKAD
jgi:hypothetical protein